MDYTMTTPLSAERLEQLRTIVDKWSTWPGSSQSARVAIEDLLREVGRLKEAILRWEATVRQVEQERDEATVKAVTAHNQFLTHLTHCNSGEHPDTCKYGDDDCPALTEQWRWLGKALDQAQRVRDLEAALRAVCSHAEEFFGTNKTCRICEAQLEEIAQDPEPHTPWCPIPSAQALAAAAEPPSAPPASGTPAHQVGDCVSAALGATASTPSEAVEGPSGARPTLESRENAS